MKAIAVPLLFAARRRSLIDAFTGAPGTAYRREALWVSGSGRYSMERRLLPFTGRKLSENGMTPVLVPISAFFTV